MLRSLAARSIRLGPSAPSSSVASLAGPLLRRSTSLQSQPLREDHVRRESLHWTELQNKQSPDQVEPFVHFSLSRPKGKEPLARIAHAKQRRPLAASVGTVGARSGCETVTEGIQPCLFSTRAGQAASSARCGMRWRCPNRW
jgi:hypothetical protein